MEEEDEDCKSLIYEVIQNEMGVDTASEVRDCRKTPHTHLHLIE